MSLQVWLPLKGDLTQQGLSGVEVVNNGATVNNEGKIGKCYQFGSGKYIKIIDYASEFLTYETFSLSVWFKCTAQNTSHTGSALISSGNWNAAANLLNLALGNFSSDHYTKILISGSGNWGNGYNYNFYLNTWYHIVLTSGNGAMRVYVNGELIGDSYAAFTPGTLEQTWICIGNGTYNQSFSFYGLMNDVRIYDHCLSMKEVKELSKGLVLHYKLNDLAEEYGSIVFDSSGYNYNAVSMTENLELSTNTVKYSHSTHFGANDYIKLESPNSEIKTISLWAKWDSIPSGQSIIFVDYKSKLGLGLMSTGILCGTSGPGNYYTYNKSGIVANTWYHFVVVNPGDVTGTSRKLYINGIEQTPTTSVSNWTYAVSEMQIGKRSTSSDGFAGLISDFRAYATALSADDILELYHTAVSIDKQGNLFCGEVVE